MESKEALEEIKRDGVFLNSNGEIDSKRTCECFSDYCNKIKQDLERLEELENDRLLDRAEKEELERVNKVLNHNLEEKVEIIFELEKKLESEFEDSADAICKVATERDKLFDENIDLKFDLSALNEAKKIEINYDEKLLKQIETLKQENQELKDEKRYYKDKYLDLYNSYQNCEDLKRKKAIEILKEHYTLKPMIWCGKPTIHITYNWDEFEEFEVITQQEFELLREVLE